MPAGEQAHFEAVCTSSTAGAVAATLPLLLFDKGGGAWLGLLTSVGQDQPLPHLSQQLP